MKNKGKVLLASLLVVALLTISFGTVFATAPSSYQLVDPLAVAGSGSVKFTQLVLAPLYLPGTVTADNLILPDGFKTGQAQFSGNGIRVSGLKAGETVSLTFDYYFYNFMWSGSIYKWSGTQWMKLATTVIPAGADGVTSWAKVSGVGNGTYALIIGNYGLPPVDVQPTPVPTEIPPEIIG